MTYKLLQGNTLDILKTLPSNSVQACITSPPYYGLRDYGVDGQIGLEPTVNQYLDTLIEIFSEVRRVLTDTGTCWVNLGDSYFTKQNSNRNGISSKALTGETRGGGEYKTQKRLDNFPKGSLLQIPSRFSLRMTDELGFVLRNQIIWHKPSVMPSSALNRFTVDFEPIFFFAKNPKYKFNLQIEDGVIPAGTKGAKASVERSQEAMINSRPPKYYTYTGKRIKRTTWSVTFEHHKNKHYASYPTKLIEPMVLASTDEGDTILDPFNGTATTGVVALKHGRDYIGIDIHPDYIAISEARLNTY